MANFLRGLGQVAGVAGQAVKGYGLDQEEATKRALLTQREKRDAEAFALAQKVGTANLAESDLGMKVKNMQLAEGSFQASPEFADLVKRARTGDQAAQAQVIARVPQMGSQFLQGDRPEDVAKASYEALKLAYPKHPVSATAYRPGVDYGKVFSQAQDAAAQGAAADRQTTALTQQEERADKKRTDSNTRVVQKERAAYQNIPAVKDAYGIANAITGIRASAKGDTPANDLALIYSLVKFLDPGSVVREGEINLVRAARSLGTQVTGAWNKAKKGILLTPQERQNILGLIDNRVAETEKQIAPIQRDFGAAARSFGLAPGDSATIAPNPFSLRDAAVPGGVNVTGLIKKNRPAGRP